MFTLDPQQTSICAPIRKCIRDLAMIGDQRTAAALSNDGAIVWYCPERFDRPSLFAALLDPAGGTWGIDTFGAIPVRRSYVENSAVLKTVLLIAEGEWSVTDWMPMGDEAPRGLICRMFSAAPRDLRIFLTPRPNYAKIPPNMVAGDNFVQTSLPEVRGSSKNWDYRYIWLRDAGMIVSALARLGGDLTEAGGYLDFMCRSRGSSSKYPMAVFVTIDGKAAPKEQILDFVGFQESRPVKIGNNAGEQLQLDGFANVLLAAKLLYQRIDQRPHWDAVEEIAEFLVENWREPDHGIWEEEKRQQYTANKVIVACGLSSVAEFSTNGTGAALARRCQRDPAFRLRELLNERGCLRGDRRK